jgi:hypothetical protein
MLHVPRPSVLCAHWVALLLGTILLHPAPAQDSRPPRRCDPSVPRREAIQILSYREADSMDITRFAFPGGATLEYHGRIEGDRWVMHLQPGPNWPANQLLRTIITAVPGGLRYVEEHSVDGGPWTLTEDYRHRRVR